MFLATTKEEMSNLGWDSLDIILVSGDTYIDSSFNGTAVIGKWLLKHGFRVGVIAQPDISSPDDITRLGSPELFWGVSAGSVDSMVANYTAAKKRRKSDDFTPGGLNNRRPDRATISYTNLIKKYFKHNQAPIVLGGIEASLRRIVHYDFWSNKVRKPVLFDAKADIISYGMGEKSMLELALAMKRGEPWENIRGISYISKVPRKGYLELPSFDECQSDKLKFIEAFETFYLNCDPLTAKGIFQKQDTRYLVQNPPSMPLSTEDMDSIYNMEFEREVHPYYKNLGEVKGIETIKHSITTHRGCYGECNFCAIAVHQGRTVIGRSEDSIISEAKNMIASPKFKGYISDVGGPTANMYGIECEKKLKSGACKDKRCMYPETCSSLKPNHLKQLSILKKLEKLEGVKKIFIASGIRYDLVLSDNKCGNLYLKELVQNHVSGQLKIAPEHTEDKILSLMGKQGKDVLKEFKERFYKLNKDIGKSQFLTYYLIAAHPGCNEKDMQNLKKFASKELQTNPEQVQIFTPTPLTYSTLMYYTEMDPFTGKKLFVEKDQGKKQKQKDIIVSKNRNDEDWKKHKKTIPYEK
jgi:uncharacterized radical SAM protein YgiQ